jgi:hypothetical protein
MDKLKEIEKMVLSVLNAHALPPVVISYKDGKIESATAGFVRDDDGKFKTIANEIAKKIIDEENNTRRQT